VLLGRRGIEVRDSDAPFERSPHLRTKRPSPPPLSFRR
jgi:hypothetical protein